MKLAEIELAPEILDALIAGHSFNVLLPEGAEGLCITADNTEFRIDDTYTYLQELIGYQQFATQEETLEALAIALVEADKIKLQDQATDDSNNQDQTVASCENGQPTEQPAANAGCQACDTLRTYSGIPIYTV